MDLILVKDFFRETSLDALAFVSLIGIFYVMVNLVRAMDYERRIEIIKAKKQKEIYNFNESIKNSGMMQEYADRMLVSIKNKYQPNLDRLDRKRKFILERLPFFKN